MSDHELRKCLQPLNSEIMSKSCMAHKNEVETNKTLIWQTENIHPIFSFYKIPTSSINSLFPISSLSSCVKYDIDLKA